MRGTAIEHLSLISAIPVNSAWYCMDCEAVTSQPQCAYCASSNVTPLRTIMDGQTIKVVQTVESTYIAGEPCKLCNGTGERTIVLNDGVQRLGICVCQDGL